MLAMPVCESKWQPPAGDSIRVSRRRLEAVLSRLCPQTIIDDLKLLWPDNKSDDAVVSTIRGTYLLSGSPSIDVLDAVKAIADKKNRKKRKSKARLQQSAASESMRDGHPHHHGPFVSDGIDPELGKVATVAVVAAWRSCLCKLTCCLPDDKKKGGAVGDEVFPETLHDLGKCPLCSRLYETASVANE